MPTAIILTNEQKNQSLQDNTDSRVTVGGVIPGTEKVKDPLSEGQKKQAGFALRMENAIKRFDELEASGFNPVNLKDVMIDNAPFVPEAVERFFTSSQYKQYQRAIIDFATAQLRQETGAVINDSEIDWMYLTYFPALFDDQKTLADKKQARQDAYIAMRTLGGKAFDKVKKETEEYNKKMGLGGDSDQALQILRERAKNDPKIRTRLKEAGLL